MTRVIRKFSILMAAVAALSATASAALIVVDQGGAGNHTTIQAAVNAAGAGDTVQINSGTYTEAVSLTGKSSLTLQSADGAAVRIKAPDASTHAIQYGDGAYNLVIRGSDTNSRLVLEGNGNSAIDGGFINSGSLAIEYVEFTGPTAGFGSHLRTADNGVTVTLNHCKWSTSKSSSSTGFGGLVVEGPSNFMVNDGDFVPVGRMNGIRSLCMEPGILQVNRTRFFGWEVTAGFQLSEDPACVFDSLAGSSAQTIIMSDCRFNGYNWVYEVYNGATNQPLFPVGSPKTFRLINPEVGVIDDGVHGVGETRMVGIFKTWSGEKISIEGHGPDDKADLTKSHLFFDYIRVLNGGDITLQDCILNNGEWTGLGMDNYGDSNHPSNITVNRCIFPGVGTIETKNQSGIIGTGAITINVNNSIVQFYQRIFDYSWHGSAVNIHFKHTTFRGIDTPPTDAYPPIGLEPNDSMTADYCIFEQGEATMPFSTRTFTGATNIIHSSAGTGFSGDVPSDTLFIDPYLLESGKINNASSPAIDAATGSVEMIDCFGTARTLPDIGAHEFLAVNAVRSDVWSVYQ